MRRWKKIVAVALTASMTFGMSFTAFATELEPTTEIAETADITIVAGNETGSEYAAYRLLRATDGGDGKIAYTLHEKYTQALVAVTGQDTPDAIIAYIADLQGSDIAQFAKEIMAKIQTLHLDADITAIADGKNAKIASAEQGYYLIAETQAGMVGDQDGSYSLLMLDTKGQEALTVNTKEDVPSVQKKIIERNDSVSSGDSPWQDAADYDLGDEIPYRITGTVSSKIADYQSYYYQFTDKMTHLTYNSGSAQVTIGSVDVTDQFDIVWNDATKVLTVTTQDLKAVTGVTIDADTEVLVDYVATLDEDAVIGSQGNPNTVDLTYANNPYADGNGTDHVGKTPEDKNIVFTYQLVANKVDKDGNALSGAGFTLYKFDAAQNQYVAVGNEIKNTTTFTFPGIDAGQYKLVESTVPAGYNRASDLEFKVVATYGQDTDGEDALQLTGLKVTDLSGNPIVAGNEEVFSYHLETGSATTNIVNVAGIALPSTGGIGTTIFYLIGGALIVGAGVVLVTKKRMKDDK